MKVDDPKSNFERQIFGENFQKFDELKKMYESFLKGELPTCSNCVFFKKKEPPEFVQRSFSK